MVAGADVAGNDGQTKDSLPLPSKDEMQPTLTEQQLRHRQQYAADDEVTDSKSEFLDEGDHHDKDVSKLKKRFGPLHYRKNSNASDDGNGSHHGLFTGLMKKAGFGSQEFKEKDMHASDGYTRAGSHGFMGFMKRVSNQEFKHGDGHHHHHHYHYPHGTRDKEIFGSEDADGNYREHEDLFGFSDMEHPHNIEEANSLFGFEDIEFERREKGRDLFGVDDPNTESFREKINIVGPVEADESEIERTRHVFGDENVEDSADDLECEKHVHHGHSVSD